MFVVVMLFADVFFFKQKTAYEMRISDWSSDVCSSDLRNAQPGGCGPRTGRGAVDRSARNAGPRAIGGQVGGGRRLRRKFRFRTAAGRQGTGHALCGDRQSVV